jgi:aspartate kinase
MSHPYELAPTRPLSFERERGITEVRIQEGLAHVEVRLPGRDIEAERLTLLQAVAEAGLPVLLIKLHPDSVSFALPDATLAGRAEKLLVNRGYTYALEGDLALISICAGAMRDLSGVMAGLYDTMDKAGIRVAQTGDSHDALFALISGTNAGHSATLLRQTFGLSEGDGTC